MDLFTDSFAYYVWAISGALTRPQTKFLTQALWAMMASKSVNVSAWARHLLGAKDVPVDLHADDSRQAVYQRNKPFFAAVKRLTRMLKNPRFDDAAVYDDYLVAFAKPNLHNERLGFDSIAIDETDLAKFSARKMEYLGWVTDRSLRQQKGDVAGPGYKALVIEAVGKGHHRMPLRVELYNDNFKDRSPNYDAGGREGMLARAMWRLADAVPATAVWTADRGYDSQKIFSLFSDFGRDFIIRLKASRSGSRELRVDGLRERVNAAIARVEYKTSTQFRVPTRRKDWAVEVGWFTDVRVRRSDGVRDLDEWDTNVYSLVVVAGLGKQPMALLTSIRVDSAAKAKAIVKSYAKRWGAEEAHRLIKQCFGLERVMVRSWTALQRMCLLCLLAYGYSCTLANRVPERVKRLLRRVIWTVKAAPRFLSYRIIAAARKLIPFQGCP